MTQLEAIRKDRKPMPKPSRVHSSKKGKRGYNRKRDKKSWKGDM